MHGLLWSGLRDFHHASYCKFKFQKTLIFNEKSATNKKYALAPKTSAPYSSVKFALANGKKKKKALDCSMAFLVSETVRNVISRNIRN